MPTPPASDAVLQQALDSYVTHGCNLQRASLATGVSRTTLQGRVQEAKKRGLKSSAQSSTTEPENDTQELKHRIRVLETELTQVRRDELTREEIRKQIIGLAETKPEPPKWLTKYDKGITHGVPTLFASDWHWGEVVRASEVGGVNEYNLEIAHKRAKKLMSTSIDLLFNHFNKPQYPGIVFALGGDMVSGTIHDELVATNDKPIMPIVVDLFGALIACINTLLERFEYVYVPGVAGNHGRTTRKPIAKDRATTNFDWLIYQLLAKHFESDKRVQFNIPDGSDCEFRIYNHRYKLTHGDQFRGGDGMIGHLGPVARGRHKKASRDSSLGVGFDTLMHGHFHSLAQLPTIISNGSLKGIDEYAFQSNFSYERAAQALWITHPINHITFQMPVYVDEPVKQPTQPWLSVFGT